MGRVTSKTTDMKTGKVTTKITYTGKDKKVTKTNMKKAINRALSRNIETKCAVSQIFQQIGVPGAGLNTASGVGLGLCTDGVLTKVIPPISQGSGGADRDGDSIRAKKLQVNFSLRARDISGTMANPFQVPFYVRVIAFNHRYAIDDYSQVGLIDKGNTAGNLDSSPDSWLEPYNKKEYKIYYNKTFKMCPYYDRSVGSNPTIINGVNGFQSFIVGKFRIPVPKTWHYNGTTTLPANVLPHLAFAVCNIDGTIVSNTQFRVDVNAESRLYYSDA